MKQTVSALVTRRMFTKSLAAHREIKNVFAFERNLEKECYNRNNHSLAVMNDSSSLRYRTSFKFQKALYREQKVKSTFGLDGKIKPSIICFSIVWNKKLFFFFCWF